MSHELMTAAVLLLSVPALAQTGTQPKNVEPLDYQVLVSTQSLQIVSYGPAMPFSLNVAMTSGGLSWLMTTGADAPVVLLVAANPAQIAIGPAWLLVDPASTAMVPLSANSLGAACVPMDFNDPKLEGLSAYMQSVSVRGGQIGLSNGLYASISALQQLGSIKATPLPPAQIQAGAPLSGVQVKSASVAATQGPVPASVAIAPVLPKKGTP